MIYSIYFMSQIINRMKHILCCIALDGSVQHSFLAVKKGEGPLPFDQPETARDTQAQHEQMRIITCVIFL
jgi:hypothetical protein